MMSEKSFPLQHYCKSGLDLYHIPGTRFEIDYIYNEIFTDNDYLPNHFHIHNNDIIIDLGANIGLFSLFMLEKFSNLQLIAVEPVPYTFHALQKNLKRYHGTQHNIHLLNKAASNTIATTDIYFYNQLPANSTLNPQEKNQEFQDISSMINFQECWKINKFFGMGYIICMPLLPIIKPLAHYFMNRKLKDVEVIQCETITVNEIIKQYQLPHIDLLKIDVEGHEWPILQYINNKNWPMIKQIAIEISAHNPHQEDIMKLLTKQGYHTEFKSNTHKSNQLIRMLYATKI